MYSNEAALALINYYANEGVVVDTNLLILDFVGDYDVSKITSYKRTAAYTPEDFQQLRHILTFFRRIIVNQPILTEAFNLIDSLNNLENNELNKFLVRRISELIDVTVSSTDIMNMRSFNKFGFTDASVDYLSTYNLVLTDDLRLYHYLASQGKPVINFNHIRSNNFKLKQ